MRRSTQLIRREASRPATHRAKSTIADAFAGSTTSSTNPNSDSTCPIDASYHTVLRGAYPSDSFATATATGGGISAGLDVQSTAHDECFSSFASSGQIHDSPNRTHGMSHERIGSDMARLAPSSSEILPSAFLNTSRLLHGQGSGVDVSKHLDPEIRGQLPGNFGHAISDNRESRAKGQGKSTAAHDDPSKL